MSIQCTSTFEHPFQKIGNVHRMKFQMSVKYASTFQLDVTHRQWQTETVSRLATTVAVLTDIAVLADITVRSPRKLIIFISRKSICWVSIPKTFYLILITKSLLATCSQQKSVNTTVQSKHKMNWTL